MAERKGLATLALALGIFGLFSAGGLVLGSLLGLALAAVALAGGSSARGGRDVAWAAIAANVFALATLVPISVAVVAYRAAPFALFEDDDALPTPAQRSAFLEDAPVPPPPLPPPPPSTTWPAEPGGAAEAGPPSAPRATQGTSRSPGAQSDGPVRVGGEIAEPRKTRHVNPVYPKAAIQSRVQGVVLLECTISPAGKVVEVRTVKGAPLLTEAAIEAVRHWEYTPTLLNGVAVPVIMTVTVRFKLS
jgi:TonB family protein